MRLCVNSTLPPEGHRSQVDVSHDAALHAELTQVMVEVFARQPSPQRS